MGYAISNTSASSTYKNVFIDLIDILETAFDTENCRLIYTALTRATDVHIL
jgi:hypothetical protein